ncbi:hypothetical protein [Natrinema salsiterrestre]|uniref:Uncharacterized protein n=1 Tax=Natrinema salsiterrestre TaxID=2950540 RepID=A0A9Q4L1F9_9EURY|nr:hypothetical protein [Natrinema salsiterrestre]MDF9745824.1 hypothetical protein [Natrinema salsiterrestre]
MQRTEHSELFETDPIRQPDVEVYMPGTPTRSFLEYVEVAADVLFR